MEDDYVSHIGEQYVQIVARASSSIQTVLSMGGVADSTSADTWRIAYRDEDQLASLLQLFEMRD